MNQVHKNYPYPFILEPTKLTRLQEVLHDRYREDKSDPEDHFEVFLTGNHVLEMKTLEAVLQVENSRKKEIERVRISSRGRGTDGDVKHRVIVEL